MGRSCVYNHPFAGVLCCARIVILTLIGADEPVCETPCSVCTCLSPFASRDTDAQWETARQFETPDGQVSGVVRSFPNRTYGGMSLIHEAPPVVACQATAAQAAPSTYWP